MTALQQVLEVAIWITVLVAFACWVYVHWRFRAVLRKEQPELAHQLNGIGLSYSGGLEWIDFALRKGYLELDSSELRKSGDLLVSAHNRFQLVLAFGILLVVARFVVSLFTHSG